MHLCPRTKQLFVLTLRQLSNFGEIKDSVNIYEMSVYLYVYVLKGSIPDGLVIWHNGFVLWKATLQFVPGVLEMFLLNTTYNF